MAAEATRVARFLAVAGRSETWYRAAFGWPRLLVQIQSPRLIAVVLVSGSRRRLEAWSICRLSEPKPRLAHASAREECSPRSGGESPLHTVDMLSPTWCFRQSTGRPDRRSVRSASRPELLVARLDHPRELVRLDPELHADLADPLDARARRALPKSRRQVAELGEHLGLRGQACGMAFEGRCD